MSAPMEFTVDDARNCLVVMGEICSLAGRAVKDNRCGCLDEISPDLFEAMACLTDKARDFYEQRGDEMWQELRAYREAATPAPVAKPKRAKAKGQ